MLSRRISTARPLLRGLVGRAQRLPLVQQRYISQEDIDDPNMNGGWINPPRERHQFRDPYGDWWDKQERRNYGEPVHEDYMDLMMFSVHEYTHFPVGHAALLFACAPITVLMLCYAVSFGYPDRPSYPREFEGGLDRELGGADAVRARAPGDDYDCRECTP